MEVLHYSGQINNNIHYGVYRNGNRLVVTSPTKEVWNRLFYSLRDLQRRPVQRDYWFRCTENKNEHLICGEIRSQDAATGREEAGLSVADHMGYQSLYQYSYIYVVTGEVAGYGADGEPVLKNARALTKPAKTLPKKWRERHEKECRQNSPVTPVEEAALLDAENWKPCDHLPEGEWKLVFSF